MRALRALICSVLVLLAAAPSTASQATGGELPAVRTALGLLEAGRPEDALEILEAAVADDGPRRFAVWSLLGRTQLRLGRAEAALGSFEAALARAPGFLPARVGRAEAEIALGRLDRATADLERLAAIAEPPPRALGLLAGLRLHRDEVEGARELWRRLAAPESPAPAGERWSAELLLLASERTPAARDRLFVEVERDLSSSAAYQALGVERLLAGDPEAAATRLRAAYTIDERDPIVRLLLGRATGAAVEPLEEVERLSRRVETIVAAWERGDQDAVEGPAREVLAARPEHAPLALIVAQIAERRGDHWEALEHYVRLLSSVGELPSLAAGAARAALAVGALGVAECSAREALRLRPGDADLMRLLAAARAGNGAPDEAIGLLREATASEPAEAVNWLRLGDLLFEATRPDEALDAYRRAVELAPAAADEIPAFALAALLGQGDEVDVELLARHAERHPDSVETLYSVGVARLRAGDLETAERLFEELARAAPRHAQAVYNLAQVYQRQGRGEEARIRMEEFRALKEAERAAWEKHNRAHFRRLEAEEDEAQGRFTAALDKLQANVSDGTATAADYQAIARLLTELGRPEEALGWLGRVLESVPDDRAALELRVRVETALGRTGAAERTRRRIELLDRPCRLPGVG